ncbi:hypothetical protein F5X68DRAFT_176087 [Plectosphaerella plurivora]|uniref:PAS domain-containing protein n=1 Tax=Plectosphaerella plurivora TaxID=936078 RepID=A0A9P8V2P9_9PEZI|nr:hypothetical protein F5X68DRAFT_176087 [Plectosphaerella plurivora]
MFHLSVERSGRRQRQEIGAQPLTSHPVTNLNSRSGGASDAGADIPDIPLRRTGGPVGPLKTGPWEDDGSNWAPHDESHPHAELESSTRAAPERPNTAYVPSPSRDHTENSLTPLGATSLDHSSPNHARGRVRSPELVVNSNRLSRGAHSWSPQRSAPTRSTRSRANSTLSSHETNATSLLPLQTKGAEDVERLEPIAAEEIEPGSYDLVVPDDGAIRQHSLEVYSELLFSKEHLAAIFEDFALLRQFTDFLASSRPDSLPLLTYYLDATKALRAIKYANAITASLERMDDFAFTNHAPLATANDVLQEKADAAFKALAQEDLPAYITSVWTQTVSVSIRRRITGTLPTQLREMSEGLAEVFCLTDPSRKDNPIVFASEEFYKTTQYGMNHVIGRNCRFLQGPKTNPSSITRIRAALAAGKEHYETFLNYRRDGSPFMNLLMMAPLYDSRGTEEMSAETEALDPESLNDEDPYNNKGQEDQDEFRYLTEMFNAAELEAVRTHGGDMYRIRQDDPSQGRDGAGTAGGSHNWNRPRILIKDESWSSKSTPVSPSISSGRLAGVYTHYLLVRPYPSLRILFASPSLRVPGILQSPFLSKIGGSDRVRDGITQALASGQGVTAKIRWMPRSGAASTEGRPRWIHCTPLLGSNGAVGVWMVVLVDEETDEARSRAPQAPPVNYGMRPSRHDPAMDLDDDLSLSGFAAMNGYHEGVDSRPGSRQTWLSQAQSYA